MGDPLRWSMMPMVLNAMLLVGFGLSFPASVRAFFDEALKVLGVSL